MKEIYILLLLLLPGILLGNSLPGKNQFLLKVPPPSNTYIALSQNFLYAVKTDGDYQYFLQLFCTILPTELSEDMKLDKQIKAFWLNIYNAYTQMKLKEQEEIHTYPKGFFTDKTICVAGREYSLNSIEHNILRRSKFSSGKLKNCTKPIVSKEEKDLRVKSLDPRIHFALNCGATGCPPIRFYEPNELDQQLDLAGKNFLMNQVKFNQEDNNVKVPELFKWFKKDFGGEDGILKLLKKYELVDSESNPEIIYIPYNWDIQIGNFAE